MLVTYATTYIQCQSSPHADTLLTDCSVQFVTLQYDREVELKRLGFGFERKFVVVIFTHARAELLEQSLTNFSVAKDRENWLLIVVQQAGSKSIDRILKKYESDITLTIKFVDIGFGVLGNINYSRLLGTSIAFNQFKANLVLGIEEDTKISKDSLQFIGAIYKKYRLRPDFRGVNLCSNLPYDSTLANSFSTLRFGLSGQAGAITLRTWKKMKLSRLLRNIGEEEWASRMEPIMKTGFVVHPNNSRLFDQGWGGFSSGKLDSSSEGFILQHKSWVGEYIPNSHDYVKENKKGVWRQDAIVYKFWQNPYFSLRRFSSARLLYKFWKFLRLPKINLERD